MKQKWPVMGILADTTSYQKLCASEGRPNTAAQVHQILLHTCFHELCSQT